MMDLVVDANIIFAAFIKDGKTVELLLDPNFNLFAPKFLMEELLNHSEELLEKTHRSLDEFFEIWAILGEKITFVPSVEFDSFLPLAQKITPDIDDVAYLALALKLSIPIWSNDVILKEGQKTVLVYTTNELLLNFYTNNI